MAFFALDNRLLFPPVELSEPNGLLAAGGDLSTERILLAYRSGIFPWYEGDSILWWCPDPRFVLFPGELKISKSMKQVFRKNMFRFTVNTAFPAVIGACGRVPRRDQDGTWISEDMREAYIRLHREGYCHSAEAWQGDTLVGGLYGMRLGSVFFGESMFSLVSNASKFAFISYVQQLMKEGVQLIDCQVYTGHLESLGARMIPRKTFMELLHQNLVAR